MSEPFRVLGIHHVAFAHDGGSPVHVALESLLGLAVGHEEPADGFVERMVPVGGSFLQTLEATGPGIVERFVERRGSALHHVALAVDNVAAAVETLRAAGVRLLDITPRPGGMGTSIAFVHPAACGGLLLELVEEPKEQRA